MYPESVSQNDASLYAFLIYTPIIIFTSWLLEMTIDTPSKDLAGEIDRELRAVPVRSRKPVKRKTCCEFMCTNWKVYGLVIYLLSLFIVTEGFGLIDPETKNRVYWEGTDTPKEKNEKGENSANGGHTM